MSSSAKRSAAIVAAFAFAAAAVVAVAWRSAAMERSRVERDVLLRLGAQAGEAAARVDAFVEQMQQRALTDPDAVVVEERRLVAPPPPRPLVRLADSGGADAIGDAQLAAAAPLEVEPAKAAEAEALFRRIVAAPEASHPAVRRLALFRLAALLERGGRGSEANDVRRSFVDELPADGPERRSAEALFARIALGEKSDALRDDLLLALGSEDEAFALGMWSDAGLEDEAAIARRRVELARIGRWQEFLEGSRGGAFGILELQSTLVDGDLVAVASLPDGSQRLLRSPLAVDLPVSVRLAAISGTSPSIDAPSPRLDDVAVSRTRPIDRLFGWIATAAASDAELRTETTRRLRMHWLALGGLLGGGALLLWFTLRAVRRESEAAAARTAFVARVSHDLRTPLSVIRMYVETLASGRATKPEEIREFAGVAAREAARLTTLVARVLDFSRAAKGGAVSSNERVDVGDLLGELAEEQRAALSAAGMQLGLVVSGGPLLVRGDREGLRTACANLIENALRHATGGERVEIAVAARDDGEIEVSVSDRGPGLPAGLEAKIFEPFVRGPQARPGGSGLGLALVREIAAAHRGEVSAMNRDGGGAIFRLRLPRAEPRT